MCYDSLPILTSKRALFDLVKTEMFEEIDALIFEFHFFRQPTDSELDYRLQLKYTYCLYSNLLFCLNSIETLQISIGISECYA